MSYANLISSQEFRSSHSSRTEVIGLRRWVGKRKFLAGSPFAARSQPKRRTHPKTIFGCENNFHFAGRHAPIHTWNAHDKRKIKPSHPPEGCFLAWSKFRKLRRVLHWHHFALPQNIYSLVDSRKGWEGGLIVDNLVYFPTFWSLVHIAADCCSAELEHVFVDFSSALLERFLNPHVWLFLQFSADLCDSRAPGMV